MNSVIEALGWGACGAAPYAATALATALWGSDDVTPRAKKLAAATFAIALFTGPMASAALSPWLVHRLPGASLPSIALVVGLLSNVVWPLLTDKRLLKPMVSHLLDRLGGWLTGMGRSLDDDHSKGSP